MADDDWLDVVDANVVASTVKLGFDFIRPVIAYWILERKQNDGHPLVSHAR